MSRNVIIGLIAAVAAILVASAALRPDPASGNLPTEKVVRAETDEGPDRATRVATFRQASDTKAAPTPPPMRRTMREDVTTKSRSLEGRVTLLDGTPLSGALVSVNFNTSSTATSDAEGYYKIAALPDQVWGVSARHDDAITSMVRGLDRNQRTLDFVMRRKESVRFVAKVFDAVSQDPVKEYTVVINNHEVVKDSTLPGKFEIMQVFTGDQLSFRLESPNTVPREVREWISADATGTIEREYALGTGGTVKGRVVRGSTKAPVEGVVVSTRSFEGGWGGRGGDRRRDTATTATTDAEGKFMLTRLNPGTVLLRLDPDNPLLETTKFAGELQHHEVRDVGDVEIGAGGTIRGKVVQVPGNEPLPEVRVELRTSGMFGGGRGRGDDDDQTSSAITNAAGEFEFAQVPPGQQQLSVRSFQLRETETINAEETKDVTLRVGQGTLLGTVLKEGEPVVEARVSLSRNAGGDWGGGGSGPNSVETDELGEFEVANLVPGKWQVTVRTEDDRTGLFDAEIPNDGTLEKTFNMPSGDLVGKVVDAEGQPVAGARISIMSSSESVGGNSGGGRGGRWGGRGVESQADGSFRIEDRTPGVMVVQAYKEEFGYSEAGEGTVPEQGDSPPVILKLGATAGGTLVSTVLNLETGGPIQNAYLSLSTSKGQVSQRSRRGEDGVVTVKGLPPGSYNVEVGATGYTTSQKTVQIVEGQTAQITDVLSAGGSFRWTLRDSTGAAVAGAACQLTPLDGSSIETVRQGTTGEGGVWMVRGVLPGSYAATCTTADGRMSTTQVTISAGGFANETALLQ